MSTKRPYSHFKNSINRKSALRNSEKYGLFTFDRAIGKYSIAHIKKVDGIYNVYYFQEKELKDIYLDCVFGTHIEVVDNSLRFLETEEKLLTNKKKFIQAFIDKTKLKLDKKQSLINLK